MTEGQIKLIQALAAVRVLAGSFEKKFIRDMAQKVREVPQTELTERQQSYLHKLAWTFRGQLPPEFVPASKPT